MRRCRSTSSRRSTKTAQQINQKKINESTKTVKKRKKEEENKTTSKAQKIHKYCKKVANNQNICKKHKK